MKVGFSWMMSGYSEIEFSEAEVSKYGHLTPEEMLYEVLGGDLSPLVYQNEHMDSSIYDVEEL